MPRQRHFGEPPAHGDVVAGLLDDALATAVGAMAVREAVARGARLRFLQVLTGGVGMTEHARVAAVLFDIATASLAGVPMLAVTFETVVGTAPQMLVERSRGAVLLVVGADDSGARTAVAAYCVEHCESDVMVVSEPLPSGFVLDALSAR